MAFPMLAALPIVGTIIVTILRFALKPLEEALGIYGLVELLYALLLIITMLRKPEGIMGRKMGSR